MARGTQEMRDLTNYGRWENIKRAIEAAYDNFDYSILRPCIWKDEIDDLFFLTKCMEIYFYDKTTLRCFCWSSKHCCNALKSGHIRHICTTDDSIYVLEADIGSLVYLLTYPKRVEKRIRKNSGKTKRLEEKLGHKIRSFSFMTQKGEKRKAIPEQFKKYIKRKSSKEEMDSNEISI